MPINFSNTRRNLSGGNYPDVALTGENMRVSLAAGSSWWKGIFKNVAFDCSNFNNATFVGCRFELCKMQNASFIGARFTDCTFEDCDIVASAFTNTTFMDCTLDSCKLEFSGWLESTLTRVKFSSCNLSGAILLYSYAKDVDYRGSNLHNCSVKLGCAFFRSSTFDERQWSYMQALIGQVHGIEKKQGVVMPLVDERILAGVKRMMFEDETEEFPVGIV